MAAVDHRLQPVMKWLQTAVADHATGNELDAADLIATATEHFSLEELRDALGLQIADKTTQLVQATNRDYSAFVTLSAALEGTHSALLKLRAPTAEAVQALHGLKGSLDNQERKAQLLREEQTAAHAEQHALSCYLDACDAQELAQRLLQQAESVQSTVAAATSDVGLEGELDIAIDLSLYDGGSELGITGESGSALHGGAALEALSGHGLEDGQDGAGQAVGLLPGHAAMSPLLPSLDGLSARCGLLLRAATAVRDCWLSLCAADSAAEQARDTARVVPANASQTAALPASSITARRRELSSWCQRSLKPALSSATVDVVRAADREGVDAGSGRAVVPSSTGSQAGLKDQDVMTATRAVLCAWCELGPAGPAAAQSILVDSVVLPALRTALSPPRLEDGQKLSARGLPNALDEVLAMVGAGVGGTAPSSSLPSLVPLLQASRGLPGYDIITTCLWGPLVEVLTGQALAPLLMSPSNPAAFHAAYSGISSAFARLRLVGGRQELVPPQGLPTGAQWEPLVADEGQPGAVVQAKPTAWPSTSSSSLLLSPATSSMSSTWQPKLSLYGQLRAVEVSGRLGKALAARVGPGQGEGATTARLGLEDIVGQPGQWGGAGPASVCLLLQKLAGHEGKGLSLPRAESTLHLPATAVALSCLQSAWSPAIFLPPLLGHTVATCCAVLGRYGAWLTAAAAVGAVKLEVASLRRTFRLKDGHAGEGSAGEGAKARLAPPPPGSASAVAASAKDGSTSLAVPLTSTLTLQPLKSAWLSGLQPEAIVTHAGGAGKAGPAPGTSTTMPGGVSLPPAPAGLAVPSRAAPGTSATSTTTVGRAPLTVTTTPGEADLAAWSEAIDTALAADKTSGSGASGTAVVDLMLKAAQDACGLADAAALFIVTRGLTAAGHAAALGTAAGQGDSLDLSSLPPDAVASVRGMLKPVLVATANLRAVVPYLLAVVEAAVARRCCTVLSTGVRGVSTAIRVGGPGGTKAMPSAPSGYVAASVKPLRQVLTSHGLEGLAVETAGLHPTTALTSAVLACLCTALADGVGGVLAGVQAMEASLGWLKGGQAGGFAGSVGGLGSMGAVSDGERITAQLWLDVRALGQEVQAVLEGRGQVAAVKLEELPETDGGIGLRLVPVEEPPAHAQAAIQGLVTAYSTVAAKVRAYGSLAKAGGAR